jgi:quercetin dioxygenase-like cupin family protein
MGVDVDKKFVAEEHVARFSDVMQRGSYSGGADSHMEQHRKKIYGVLGANVTSGASSHTLLPPNEGFTLNFMQCEPGNSPALHSHDTIEVFVPIKGTWRIIFQEDNGDRQEIVVGPFDVVECPVGIWRTLRNESDEPAIVMGIFSIKDGRAGLMWPQEFLDEIAKDGVEVDDRGILVKGPPVSEEGRF